MLRAIKGVTSTLLFLKQHVLPRKERRRATMGKLPIIQMGKEILTGMQLLSCCYISMFDTVLYLLHARR
jgi:hypothetical protein